MLFENDELAEKYPVLHQFTNFVKKPEREIIGRKDEMRAIWASMQRPELCNVILIGEAGSGKALDDNTMIPVNDSRGYVPIKDIRIGDEVFDENGKPCKVLGVFPQGMLDAYDVTFTDGSHKVCNDEHLWAARTFKQLKHGKDYKIYRLNQMTDNLYITDKNGGVVSKWYIPNNGACQRKDISFPVDPYALGVWLAKGVSGDILTLENLSEDVAKEFAKTLKMKAVGDEKQWQFVCCEHSASPKYVRTNKFFDNICGIPDMYLIGSVWQRYELLRGFADAAGDVLTGRDHKINDNICMVTVRITNSVVFDNFICLINSLGLRVRSVDTSPDSCDVYIHADVISAHDMFRCVRFHKQIEELSLFAKFPFKKTSLDLGITNVEKLDEKRSMTCIYVSSESHLFQAGYEHIVTHNTMLVQGTMMKDPGRIYLEVGLSAMISVRGSDVLPGTLEALFEEVMRYRQQEGKEIILFIDEFHRIIQESPPAVEALKPLLADSGTRGIKIIAATTFIEFQKWVSPNQPLVERLQRINITQPGKKMTIEILKGMADRYGISHQFYNDYIYEMIYEYTNRYIPANSQPRKSILVLDNMIGWHRAEGRKLDLALLADVIYQQEGINVAFRVDASKIKKKLDKNVLAQQFATSVIEQRLQICVADLNNKSKPMSTFLFTGSTGVGKTEMCKQLAKILFEDDRRLCRFDMTEFANAESMERFRQELTARIWAMPYCILLLDEIEKACAPVTRLLLQVLDDGRLTDANNREVVFTNCYIILTTNAGSEIYRNISQYNADDSGSGKFVKQYDKLIRSSISGTTGDNRFPPELLGRIDAIVPFQPLSETTMKGIAKNKLGKLRREVLSKHDVMLEFEPRVISYLVEDNLDTDSDSGGARVVMSTLESEITTAVARFINMNPNIKDILVKIEGTMASEDKKIRESSAYVSVVAAKKTAKSSAKSIF